MIRLTRNYELSTRGKNTAILPVAATIHDTFAMTVARQSSTPPIKLTLPGIKQTFSAYVSWYSYAPLPDAQAYSLQLRIQHSRGPDEFVYGPKFFLGYFLRPRQFDMLERRGLGLH
jgi:hypothetical protein